MPFIFVLTRVTTNTLITAQAAAVLSKYGQVDETFVGDRTAYKSPYPKGQTITEAEARGTVAKEMAALWANIESCLHETMGIRRPTQQPSRSFASIGKAEGTVLPRARSPKRFSPLQWREVKVPPEPDEC